MMKNFNLNAQQKKSILYAVICSGIVLIIVLVGILPYSFKVSNQQNENEKLTSQIKEQRELGPVYKTLTGNVEQTDVLILPHAQKTALPRQDITIIHKDFQAATQKSGLKIISYAPEINTSASPSASFLHNLELKGELAGFRKLLIALGALPYVERIEEISIQQNAGAMDFKMKIWTAVQ